MGHHSDPNPRGGIPTETGPGASATSYGRPRATADSPATDANPFSPDGLRGTAVCGPRCVGQSQLVHRERLATFHHGYRGECPGAVPGQVAGGEPGGCGD